MRLELTYPEPGRPQLISPLLALACYDANVTAAQAKQS